MIRRSMIRGSMMNDFRSDVDSDTIMKDWYDKNKPVRTISEILKDADMAKTETELASLWDEFLTNKKRYSLVELFFAKEHIINLSNNLL